MTKALIVMASGMPDWFEAIVKPRMQHYADRIGAVLDVIVPEKWEGMATRSQTAHHVRNYDRSLVLDADTIVSREAPDIFAAHHSGQPWLANDAEQGDSTCHRQINLMIMAQAVCGNAFWTEGYGNSGVILCDREHAELWTGWHAFPAWTCPDQLNLNFKIHRKARSYMRLGREWNSFGLNTPFHTQTISGIVHCPPLDYNDPRRVRDICHGAYIAHAAGFAGPERDAAIREMDRLLP